MASVTRYTGPMPPPTATGLTTTLTLVLTVWRTEFMVHTEGQRAGRHITLIPEPTLAEVAFMDHTAALVPVEPITHTREHMREAVRVRLPLAPEALPAD